MSGSQQDSQNDLLDSLLGDFLDESDQLLAQLNENLLQLDEWVRSLGEDHREPCDAELLNEMFRAAHSIKGLSGMMGLADINTLTHKIENVFDAARNHQLTINRDVVDLVFMGIDQLTALVELLKDPEGEPVDCDAVLEGIRQLLRSAGVDRGPSSQADADKAFSDISSETHAEIPDPFEDLDDEEDISEKYISIFIDETETALDELSETLLALEGGGNPEELSRLLVTAHRIKGSAASVGLNRAAKLAHLMEDLFQSLVETESVLSTEATDALLASTDALRQYVGRLRVGISGSDDFSVAARKLLAAHVDHPGATDDTDDTDDTGGDGNVLNMDGGLGDITGAEQGRPVDRKTFAGEVRFEPDLPMAGLKAVLIHEKLAKLGDVCDCEPPVEGLEEIDRLETFRFRVTSDEPPEKIAEQVRVAGVQEARVEPLADQVPAAPKRDRIPPVKKTVAKRPSQGAKPRPTDSATRPIQTVRVDIERLDELMNLAGQLVINKAQFSQIGEKLKAALSGKQSAQSLSRALRELDKMSGADGHRLDGNHLQTQVQRFHAQARRIQHELETVRNEVQALSRAHESVKDLLETIHQFDRVSNAVQQAVMDTRMVSIGPLFTRFNRVVRDIAREKDKDIRLEIRGEKTELDKRMIDELSDPLIHMVRNSADHGIEPPEVREAAGKPRRGTVTLEALHRGNSIVIRVGDDGKGLDTERIVSKCVEKGILTEADAEKMTPRQIHQMIWVPGMTTAEKVTGVSGRGMGMDIVKSKIEGLNGVVDIESAPGRGTTMTIKLPVTLAILPSLMVDIVGDVFAMPLEAVTEIVSVGRDQLSTVHGREMATVRGRVVSLVRLDDTLRFHRTSRGDEASQTRETTLVIVGEAGREIGLAVNRVIGEEDVVIKSIAENYKNVPGIAGASILGDGRVSLILDVPALIEMVAKKAATASC